MDAHFNTVMGMKIQKTTEYLKKNNMDAYYVDTAAQAVELIAELCPAGQTVSCGGSMTLREAGVLDLLRSGRYQFLDRDAQGVNPEEIYHQAFQCDTYFMSSNAITESGELYNVDGRGNRIAALIYGPKSVIIVAGYNKLVKDLSAAASRVREIAAPANATRLGVDTPCAKVGSCCNCHAAGRICCQYLVSAYQREPGRVKVILVGEILGY